MKPQETSLALTRKERVRVAQHSHEVRTILCHPLVLSARGRNYLPRVESLCARKLLGPTPWCLAARDGVVYGTQYVTTSF